MSQARTSLDLNLRNTDYVPQGSSNLYLGDSRYQTLFSANFAAKTTDDLDEGANLYWTDARGTTNFNTNWVTAKAALLAGANTWTAAQTFSSAATFSAGIHLALSNYTGASVSAFTGIDNAQAGTVYAQLTDLNTLRAQVNLLVAFAQNVISKAQ